MQTKNVKKGLNRRKKIIPQGEGPKLLNVLNSGIYLDITVLEKAAKESILKILKNYIKLIENTE